MDGPAMQWSADEQQLEMGRIAVNHQMLYLGVAFDDVGLASWRPGEEKHRRRCARPLRKCSFPLPWLPPQKKNAGGSGRKGRRRREQEREEEASRNKRLSDRCSGKPGEGVGGAGQEQGQD